MSLFVLKYIDNAIQVNCCESWNEIQKLDGIDEKSIIINPTENNTISKLIDLPQGKEILSKMNNVGHVAENEFKKLCIDNNLIAIRVEQTLENYRTQYKKVFNFVKRPDFYILGKDIFVEVKAKSELLLENSDFFTFNKKDLDGYTAFKGYTKKKIFFACYHIWQPDEAADEYKELLEDTLSMIDMDDINTDNEYVADKGGYFSVKKEAFKDGLKLLLEN